MFLDLPQSTNRVTKERRGKLIPSKIWIEKKRKKSKKLQGENEQIKKEGFTSSEKHG